MNFSTSTLAYMVLAVVFHAAGALVAWTVYLTVPDDRSVDRGPELPGQTTIVRLAGMPIPEEAPEPQVEPFSPPQTDVVVTPTETRIDKRTFVTASTSVTSPLPSELAAVERMLQAPPPPRLQRHCPTTSSEPPPAKPPQTRPPARRQAAIDVPQPRVSLPAAPRQQESVGHRVDTMPALVDNRPPVYPEQAARAGQQGTTLLRILVAASGAADRVEIVSSSGHPVLDAEAVRTVRTWRFVPATRNGVPVAYVIRQPVRFTLE